MSSFREKNRIPILEKIEIEFLLHAWILGRGFFHHYKTLPASLVGGRHYEVVLFPNHLFCDNTELIQLSSLIVIQRSKRAFLPASSLFGEACASGYHPHPALQILHKGFLVRLLSASYSHRHITALKLYPTRDHSTPVLTSSRKILEVRADNFADRSLSRADFVPSSVWIIAVAFIIQYKETQYQETSHLDQFFILSPNRYLIVAPSFRRALLSMLATSIALFAKKPSSSTLTL